jgi:hypothetical protein
MVLSAASYKQRMRGLVEKKVISTAKKHIIYRYESGMAADRKLAKGYSFIRVLRMFAHAGSKSLTSLYTLNDDVLAYQTEKANVERARALWSYDINGMRRHDSCR